MSDESVQRDLACMRSEVRTLRRCVCGLALLLAALVSVGFPSPAEDELRVKTIRTNSLYIDDEGSGKLIGYLGNKGTGGFLRLWDTISSRNLELSGGSGGDFCRGASLVASDGSGERRISIGANDTSDSSATIELTDPFRKPTGHGPAKLTLLLWEHVPRIYAYDENGKEIGKWPK